MFKRNQTVWQVSGLSGALLVGLGWLTGQVVFCVFGAAAVCYAALRWCGWGPQRRRSEIQQPAPAAPKPAPPAAIPDAADTTELVEQMLLAGRYALLLRPQLQGNLTEKQRQRSWESLADGMAPVPEGDVLIGAESDPGPDCDAREKPSPGRLIHVEHYYLDRYPVTNRQFLAFVASGGYEQMAIWDPEVWAAVLDFTDRSGCPGPRFWENGRYKDGEEDLPVVGVCWYEAAAFARWMGKRLPSDAEWEKAGSWPVELNASQRVQRRYPWGDTMDRARCNVWGSGPNRLVPVTTNADGMSVGGVYQLTGNVWEWTTGEYGYGDYADRALELPVPMRSIRGGAFDTYFENQATCQFRSGESPVERKHNIGFRCALSACDLNLFPPEDDGAVDEPYTEPAEPELSEV